MKKKITIKEPCTESWNEMSQTGRTDCSFCHSCQKEVIDFTQKLDSEIVSVFNTQANVCGRFTESQLEKVYHFPNNRSTPYKWLMAGLFSGFVFIQPVMSQEGYNLTKTGIELPVLKPTVNGGNKVVKGVVRDDTGEILVGVTVMLKGTEIGTVTDINGEFSLETILDKYGSKENIVLEISFLGYETLEFLAHEGDNEIILSLGSTQLKEVVVESDILFKRERVVLGTSCVGRHIHIEKKTLWSRIKNFPRWVTKPFRKKDK